MTTLHMETEQVRQAANRLGNTAAQMLTTASTLRSTAGRLSIAWQGGRAEGYQQSLRDLIRRYENQLQGLEDLASRVSREVDEWQSADSSGTSAWKDLGRFAPAILVAGSTVPFILSQTQEKFDWYKWGSDSKAIEKGWKFLTDIPYDSKIVTSYAGIGRFLNKEVFGNLKTGWVGRMNTLGHIIRGPVTVGLPLGLGIVGDLRDGDNWRRAVGSELIEFGIEKGLYAIPFVNVLFGGYQLALLTGHLSAGALEIFGMHDTAGQLQNTLETLDFTERLGDAIYDFVANPPNISVNVNLTVQVNMQFGCGLNN